MLIFMFFFNHHVTTGNGNFFVQPFFFNSACQLSIYFAFLFYINHAVATAPLLCSAVDGDVLFRGQVSELQESQRADEELAAARLHTASPSSPHSLTRLRQPLCLPLGIPVSITLYSTVLSNLLTSCPGKLKGTVHSILKFVANV